MPAPASGPSVGPDREAADPLVSVITPSLNSARFLEECLASVAAQTYRKVEHIVVDGESTDDTQSVLARHAREGLRVIVRRDRSMYEAINTGLNASRGQVVACLNADDLYFPGAVGHAVTLLLANPGVDIVFGDQLTLFMQTESFDLGYCPGEGVDPWGRVLVYITQPAVFMRRRIVDRVGRFDAGLRGASDFDYWIRAFNHGAVFKKLRSVGVMVRLHGENLSLKEVWHREHELLKDRYIARGFPRRFWEGVRMGRRRVILNRLTVPLFLGGLPKEHVRFQPLGYYCYLVSRRRRERPILSVRLPYFAYDAYRALWFEK